MIRPYYHELDGASNRTFPAHLDQRAGPSASLMTDQVAPALLSSPYLPPQEKQGLKSYTERPGFGGSPLTGVSSPFSARFPGQLRAWASALVAGESARQGPASLGGLHRLYRTVGLSPKVGKLHFGRSNAEEHCSSSRRNGCWRVNPSRHPEIRRSARQGGVVDLERCFLDLGDAAILSPDAWLGHPGDGSACAIWSRHYWSLAQKGNCWTYFPKLYGRHTGRRKVAVALERQSDRRSSVFLPNL